MYFSKFPRTFYTLDDLATVQTVKNIFVRIKISDDTSSKLSSFDLYDIKDGDTPEITADKIYGSPIFHWVILHANEIHDPRFEWPLSQAVLKDFVEDKYGNVNGIHHYEDANEKIINANVLIMSNTDTFSSFSAGDTITNVTLSGNAYVTSKIDDNTLYVTTTDGGFISSNQIKANNNTSINANITSTVTVTGTPVTNFLHEEKVNESKRRIKVLKPQFLDKIVNELENKLGSI